MFKNPGQKIMTIAKALCMIQIILFGIFGLVLIILGIDNEEPIQLLTGVFVIITGIVFSWLAYLLIYAFGTLVQKTEDNESNTGRIADKMDVVIAKMSETAKETPQNWFCKECGTKNELDAAFCMECGKKR